MRIEFKTIDVIKDGSVWPQEIDHTIKIKKVYYEKDELSEALKEMPDYECWDKERQVLIKEIK